jgi:hypothetical protein
MDENIDIEIQELEAEMYSPDFWNNKEKAQEIIKLCTMQIMFLQK